MHEYRRFGGQLQHPGVVPVHELGAFADRRPFFTMKPFKGRTLAELLEGASRSGRGPSAIPEHLRTGLPDDGLRSRPWRDPPRPEILLALALDCTVIDMPRIARASVGGVWYHALNRGNRREAVFHKRADYEAFVNAMSDAQTRLPLHILGYCVMPNHFHLVVRPRGDGDLSRWMQWLLSAHARRYHSQYGTTGHVWEGRFKAFPVQDNDHLVTVLRYVECNALRAELVARAEDWKWSSLPGWLRGDPLLWRGKRPIRDEKWLTQVNKPLSVSDLARLTTSIERGRPYGNDSWTSKTARQLGLESTLRSRGRPRTS
jgi:putative transposase